MGVVGALSMLVGEEDSETREMHCNRQPHTHALTLTHTHTHTNTHTPIPFFGMLCEKELLLVEFIHDNAQSSLKGDELARLLALRGGLGFRI